MRPGFLEVSGVGLGLERFRALGFGVLGFMVSAVQGFGFKLQAVRLGFKGTALQQSMANRTVGMIIWASCSTLLVRII